MIRFNCGKEYETSTVKEDLIKSFNALHTESSCHFEYEEGIIQLKVSELGFRLTNFLNETHALKVENQKLKEQIAHLKKSKRSQNEYLRQRKRLLRCYR